MLSFVCGSYTKGNFYYPFFYLHNFKLFLYLYFISLAAANFLNAHQALKYRCLKTVDNKIIHFLKLHRQ